MMVTMIMNMISAILLFGFGFIQVVNSIHTAVCILEKTDSGESRNEWFDPSNKICCGGRLSQLTTNLECCDGKELYFNNEKICCNGKVSDKMISKFTNKLESYCGEPKNASCIERICCGGQVLLKEDNIRCCEGSKIILTPKQVNKKYFFGCCGKDNVFDRRTEICCGNTAFPKSNIGCCDGAIYNTKNLKCVQNKQIKRTEDVCRNKVYNKLKDKCCDGQLIQNVSEIIEDANGVYRLNPDVKCCGSNAISQDERCCFEHIHGFPTHSIPNDPDLKCCGLGQFNSKSQVCLSGTALSVSSKVAVCGNSLIDTSFQDCCANKIPYDIDSQECCEGASYCVINKGEKCCNGFSVKENEVCCEYIKPCKKRYMEDDGCCFDHERYNGQTFKTKQEKCYKGQIMTVPEGHEACGPNDYYHPDSHFCCNEKKYKLDKGQCCYGVYSSIPAEKGRCCILDYQVYKFDDKTNPCMKECNMKKYDINAELCCEGRIFNYTGVNYCCGAYAIDGNEMNCCGDQFPYRPTSRKECCHHTQLYNPRHSTCTETGELEPRSQLQGLTDVEKLCHPLSMKLFDGGVQQACRRDYAITGKVVRVNTSSDYKGDFNITISLKNVKALPRGKHMDFITPTAQKLLTFDIRIPGSHSDCSVTHLKQLNRVIVLFDLPGDSMLGNKIQINELSPFFMTPRTYNRRYAVTKAISKSLCKLFS